MPELWQPCLTTGERRAAEISVRVKRVKAR